jgi:cell division protein FtsQ
MPLDRGGRLVRSVKNERKSRKTSRNTSARTSARIARIKQPQKSFGKREKFRDDPVSRTFRNMRSWMVFRRPIFVLCASLALFVVVVGLIAGGYAARTIRGVDHGIDALIADAGFGIQNVQITGNTRTPPTTLAAALNIERGQSIFGADLHGARARLTALDWVADAQVKRRYPDTITVNIVEKIPFALWQSPKGVVIVERAGDVITSKNVDQFAKLPKLAGDGGNVGADIVDAVAAHRAISARISVIERIGGRRWNLLLNDGVRVKLPEKDWQKQLDVLEHLIIDKGVLERDISEIDLRSPTHFFFVLKSAPKPDDGGKQI